MLRGNRLLFTALGIVGLLTISIGLWTWPEQPTLPNYGEANPRNAQYRPNGKECQSKTLATIDDDGKRASQAKACEKEAEEYRQNTNDLIQQTRAADAAKAQANIASQQLWTAWLQTLGGFLTLAAAVGAAIYARDAAKHTRDANEIALSTQRAWIALRAEPQLSRPHKNGLYFRINVIAENVGQTSATHFGMTPVVLWFAPNETQQQIIDRVDGVVGEYLAKQKIPETRILPPGDIDVGSYWDSKFPPELIMMEAVEGVKATHPVLLIAVCYRTVQEPSVIQASWRTWGIGGVEDNTEALSGVRMDKVLHADKLHVMPLIGMRHKQYPANDDKRNREGG